MLWYWHLFCVFATISLCNAVKVNMQGSLSLGQEVMDTLNHYLHNSYSIDGRRSMIPNMDPVAFEVKSAMLCRKLILCTKPLRKFVDKYVVSLARSIQNAFDEINNPRVEVKLASNSPIFRKLEGSLHDGRKVLKAANTKATNDNEAYIWVGVVKKISGKLLTNAIAFVTDNLDQNSTKDLADVKKRLNQKIVINVVETEAKYQKSLCYDYDICSKSVECTTALKSVLEQLITLSDSKIREFMRSLFELLPKTNFYQRLEEVTSNELQVILNDMAFTDSVPTKEILKTVLKTVTLRLETINTKYDARSLGRDVVLLHSILSDIDLLYSKEKAEPFHVALNSFVDWTSHTGGGSANSFIKQAIGRLQDTLQDVPEELNVKLTYEVRVFLESTVDPETNLVNK